VVTGESQRGNAPAVPSRLAADEVTGEFGANSVLKSMTGTGHASMEETNAAGTRQTSTGDRVEAQFFPQFVSGRSGQSSGKGAASGGQGTAGQIQSAVLEGHVLLTQQPVAKPGTQLPAMLRAWAGRADYDGKEDYLHLTLSPRVEDGGLQLSADKIDVSHESGDAFAHENVKATWLETSSMQGGSNGKSANGAASVGQGGVAFGGKEPAHVIAADAQLHQATGEATFRGHARLWQQANSVAGPVIVLDRQKQTLVAHSADPAEPVKAVLLSTGNLGPGAPGKQAGTDAGKDAAGKSNTPSVISVLGGDLKYSDAERKAVMRSGSLGTVTAETASATSVSNEVELILLPAGNHAGKDGGQAQVDRMTARGHVVVTSDGRRGTGEQLVYTGETGEYVLTGTAAAPPRMNDPSRGNVTGEALIFHSRDDSVSIEGGGQRTTTETTAPK
jgi:lipopolysaccharide export system protein LptA